MWTDQHTIRRRRKQPDSRLVDESGRSEMALTIVDDRQGRGLSTELLTRLSGRARSAGIHRFTALVAACRAAHRSLPRAGSLRADGVDGRLGRLEAVIGRIDPGLGRLDRGRGFSERVLGCGQLRRSSASCRIASRRSRASSATYRSSPAARLTSGGRRPGRQNCLLSAKGCSADSELGGAWKACGEPACLGFRPEPRPVPAGLDRAGLGVAPRGRHREQRWRRPERAGQAGHQGGAGHARPPGQ